MNPHRIQRHARSSDADDLAVADGLRDSGGNQSSRCGEDLGRQTSRSGSKLVGRDRGSERCIDLDLAIAARGLSGRRTYRSIAARHGERD